MHNLNSLMQFNHILLIYKAKRRPFGKEKTPKMGFRGLFYILMQCFLLFVISELIKNIARLSIINLPRLPITVIQNP